MSILEELRPPGGWYAMPPARPPVVDPEPAPQPAMADEASRQGPPVMGPVGRHQGPKPRGYTVPTPPVPVIDRYDGSSQDQANCIGLDARLFFPERGESTAEAKAVCAACVVREACLEFALARGEKHGIWGGKSERERRRLRRDRAVANTRGGSAA